MVNTQLLDEKIEKSGLKIGFIVDKLGISWNGFNKKKTGKIPFRAAEIYVIGDLLSLNDAEKDEIFFADKVEL